MSLLTSLLPRKGAVYGGAAILLGLSPQPFTPIIYAADQRAIQLPEQTPRDWVMTNAARRALQKDEQLGALALGVSVNNKVATVWGTIPSIDAFSRAEELLKKLGSIAAVINECRIVPNDPFPQAVADAVKKHREPIEDAITSAKPVVAPTTRTVAKPSVEVTPPPVVLDPRTDSTKAPAALLTPPTFDLVPPSGGNDWDWILASDKRFKDLKIDVSGGVVRIQGVVVRMKDAWDLVEKLNALPEVKQVIMGKVTEK